MTETELIAPPADAQRIVALATGHGWTATIGEPDRIGGLTLTVGRPGPVGRSSDGWAYTLYWHPLIDGTGHQFVSSLSTAVSPGCYLTGRQPTLAAVRKAVRANPLPALDRLPGGAR